MSTTTSAGSAGLVTSKGSRTSKALSRSVSRKDPAPEVQAATSPTEIKADMACRRYRRTTIMVSPRSGVQCRRPLEGASGNPPKRGFLRCEWLTPSPFRANFALHGKRTEAAVTTSETPGRPLFRSLSFLGALPEEALAQLVKRGRMVRFTAGETIYR